MEIFDKPVSWRGLGALAEIPILNIKTIDIKFSQESGVSPECLPVTADCPSWAHLLLWLGAIGGNYGTKRFVMIVENTKISMPGLQ